MTGESRTWVLPLAGALTLHALVAFLGLRVMPEEADADDGNSLPGPDRDLEIEVALTDDREPPVREAPPLIANAVRAASSGALGRVRAAISTTEVRADVGSAETGAYAVDPSAPPGSTPPIDLGIEPGSWARWGAFATEPATSAAGDGVGRAPSPASSTGGLAEALEAFDHQLAVRPAGAVLSAVREAAMDAEAPRSGAVQFAITLYGSGEVDVALTAFLADRTAWTEVGKRIASSIQRRPPRLKSNRRGVRWVVALAAEERLPNGNAGTSEGPRPSLSLPALRSSEDAKADLERRNPAAAPPPGSPASMRPLALVPDTPGVFVSGRGRAGTYAIGGGLFAEVGNGDPAKRITGGLIAKGNIDPVNIVGRPTRTVSTRLLSETAL